VAADGRLYFPNQEGLIVVVKAGPKYEELAVNDMEEETMSTPAISDGALFVRTRGHLYALAEDGGE
jgi:outer membrane protein assembly factor BamB